MNELEARRIADLEAENRRLAAQNHKLRMRLCQIAALAAPVVESELELDFTAETA